MTEFQFNSLMDVLERIASALENINATQVADSNAEELDSHPRGCKCGHH